MRGAAAMVGPAGTLPTEAPYTFYVVEDDGQLARQFGEDGPAEVWVVGRPPTVDADRPVVVFAFPTLEAGQAAGQILKDALAAVNELAGGAS